MHAVYAVRCLLVCRLIISRLTKLFVFLENWTFCCPVLGSRHCTCAYTETVDPACWPSIPPKWYWHGIVQQGSARFNLTWKRYRPLPFSPLEVHTLCSGGKALHPPPPPPTTCLTHPSHQPWHSAHTVYTYCAVVAFRTLFLSYCCSLHSTVLGCGLQQSEH